MMTRTQSAPIAVSVSAVSLSDSPLTTAEALAEMFITSALIHFPAISNEARVRVELS